MPRPPTAGALALGAAFISVSVRVEPRAPQPPVDVRLIARPGMALLYVLSFLRAACGKGPGPPDPSFSAAPRDPGVRRVTDC
ncbi:hypothetical protein [Streptomyces sp. NPDC056949]|uniref:hypothetical protein n=1 Tax=Streptomyces sp. NPDC056949 TaxID=3345976 RepID=UPI0036353AF9